MNSEYVKVCLDCGTIMASFGAGGHCGGKKSELQGYFCYKFLPAGCLLLADVPAMSVKEALAYCRKHKARFIMEGMSDGSYEYENLVSGLKDGSIHPSHLSHYGMWYG